MPNSKRFQQHDCPNDDGVIESIEQEVCVGLPDGVAHGNELKSITRSK